MRKARRRQQKRSLEQMQYSEAVPSDLVILSSVPVPPTLPALPARQLPHRCKKQTNESIPLRSNLPQLVLSEDMDRVKVEENFKLPELVPYKSVIAKQGHLINNNQPWRTVEVMTGNGPGLH